MNEERKDTVIFNSPIANPILSAWMRLAINCPERKENNFFFAN
jgi:hypothetical protein